MSCLFAHPPPLLQMRYLHKGSAWVEAWTHWSKVHECTSPNSPSQNYNKFPEQLKNIKEKCANWHESHTKQHGKLSWITYKVMANAMESWLVSNGARAHIERNEHAHRSMWARAPFDTRWLSAMFSTTLPDVLHDLPWYPAKPSAMFNTLKASLKKNKSKFPQKAQSEPKAVNHGYSGGKKTVMGGKRKMAFLPLLL